MTYTVASIPVALLFAWLKYVTSNCGSTVRAVDPVRSSEVAEMLVEPTALAAATPAGLILAMEGFEDDQAVESVRFWVLPSLKVPVAVSCSVVPSMIDEFAGATAMETRTGGETVSGSLVWTEAEVAVTVAEPTPWAVTNPVALTVAIPVGVTDQMAESVMVFWLPSLKVATASSCRVSPFGIEGLCGLTLIDTKIAEETVSGSLPLTEFKPAVTVAEPTARAVTNPVALTVAIPVGTTDQVAELVMVVWLPSLKVAIASSCRASPFGTEGPCGLTAIDTTAAVPTVRVTEAVTEPDVAVSLVLPTSLPDASPAWLMLATEG